MRGKSYGQNNGPTRNEDDGCVVRPNGEIIALFGDTNIVATFKSRGLKYVYGGQRANHNGLSRNGNVIKIDPTRDFWNPTKKIVETACDLNRLK